MKDTKRLTVLFIALILVFCSFTACSEKSEETKKDVKYKKDSLQEITFTYPDNYTPDYRDDNQTSYLLNKNEGIIFIVRWDENIKADISHKGELKEFNGIKGYYWKDDEGYTIAFLTKAKNGNLVEYHIYAEDEEVFWNVVNSTKIKEQK